jgi:hypothetical protein
VKAHPMIGTIFSMQNFYITVWGKDAAGLIQEWRAEHRMMPPHEIHRLSTLIRKAFFDEKRRHAAFQGEGFL